MAKKSILDGAKVHGFRDKSQVLYGMSDFWRIREKVKSMWDNTKAEPNRERIPLQHRIVSRYKDEMEKWVESDNTFYTAKNLSNETLRLDTYFNEVEPEIERYFDEEMDYSSIWHVSIDVCGAKEGQAYGRRNVDIISKLEQKIRDEGVPRMECKAIKNEYGAYTPEAVNNLYLELRENFEFKICFRICDDYQPDFPAEYEPYYEPRCHLTHRELATYAEAFCLYIALKNELNKLKEEADMYGITLEEKKQPQEEQVDEGEWRTGWIDLCFTEAEKAEWVKHISVNKYEWTFGEPKNASLAYFVKRMLDPDGRKTKPEWKLWENLFGIRNLRNSAAQVKAQIDWAKTIDHFIDRLKTMRSED